MPELIGLCEDHADHRDKFEVFAVHDDTLKTFADLDEKLVKIKKGFWQGKDLPFPMLLDTTAKTHKTYGVRAHPTGLLIDPDGKVVGEATPSDLEAKLPSVSPAKKWARHRDMYKHTSWSFTSGDFTPAQFASMVKRFTDCDVELDAEALKASGLTADGGLAARLIGGPVTLRSIEELFLAPHGLGVVPAADGKKLLITKRPGTKEAESYLQKLHAKELTAKLDPPPADKPDEAKPLEIKEQKLFDALKLIQSEFDLPFALDAKAIQAKVLDPQAKVSGTIDPKDLRKSLAKLLEPLGLKVEVRQEALVVTGPK